MHSHDTYFLCMKKRVLVLLSFETHREHVWYIDNIQLRAYQEPKDCAENRQPGAMVSAQSIYAKWQSKNCGLDHIDRCFFPVLHPTCKKHIYKCVHTGRV